MILERLRFIKIEQLILGLIDAYEATFDFRLPTMEKLITGAIWKRNWHHAMCVFVNLSSAKVADRLEPYLFSSSRRDTTGTNLTRSAWLTYRKLSMMGDFSDRELRVAAMRGFLDKQGKVDILMSLVRCLALLAAGFITAIALVFLAFVIALWSGFIWDTHILVVAFQLVFFPALSVFMALICLAISYGIFVNGVLPLSIAYKIKSQEMNFLRNGVLYKIHE